MADIFSILAERFKSTPKKRVILEIGAADGGDTLKIIESISKDCDYFAFEPDPRNIAVIRSGDLMRVPQFKLIEAAIGDRNQNVTLNLSSGFTPENPAVKDHWYSSSVKTPKQHLEVHPWCKFDSSCDVRMMRLDDVCALYGIEAIDFIWCDIQGAEDLMISGAMKSLGSTQLLYTECEEAEMYDGQIGYDEMLRRLPGEWKVVERWPSEVLFENQAVL